MVVISYGTLKEFFTVHAGAMDALNNWCRAVCLADWSDYHEMKQMFGSVDAVGNDRFVFNIKGNSFRLIAMIFFDVRTVYVRFVGTHAEYDKLKDCSLV
ncbi:type II toxin-antitoxin system HigB family toxin [Pedobacter sp. WC2501]|uniref:type II toxin-antitoxin system HigB family toxin n=1 Tax=Pedobacter sp. WC2501 TaxID=3461400 RepID=UPI00404614ED